MWKEEREGRRKGGMEEGRERPEGGNGRERETEREREREREREEREKERVTSKTVNCHHLFNLLKW
jgi:hypothetical protein